MGRLRHHAAGELGYLALAVLLVVLVNGCGGRTQLDQSPGAAVDQVYSSADIVDSGIAFPRTVSLALADQLELAPRLNGAEYRDDLPYLRAQRNGDTVELIPATEPGPGITGAAYCIYRLRCYHAAESADLAVELEGGIHTDSACWIGWSNWDRGCWEWSILSATGVLVIDPVAFSTEEHFGYVAIVAAGGSDPVRVNSVAVSAVPDGIDSYTLYTPLYANYTYLIDSDSNVVREWVDDCNPSCSVYLLDGLRLLRPVCTGTNPVKGTGAGGGIKRWDAAGNVEWFADIGALGISQHHDIEPLLNGNILVLAWDLLSKADSIAEGRNPDVITSIGMIFDCIYELAPNGEDGAEIVWEWHLTDHLVQDFDPVVNNYGEVAACPGLLDINFTDEITPDFSHGNAVEYNADLDQIILNLRSTCELYIIDHSTTTEEAAGTSGGNSGRGGDFLYRWGNPAVWDAGTDEDKLLFFQHDVKWITDDCPGAGHLLMFNNGGNAFGNRYSRVVEIIPPLQADGSYAMDGGVYGPAEFCWEFEYAPRYKLYSQFMSGAQRLPDGNTLICSAEQGWFIEVTTEGEVVWSYYNRLPTAETTSVFRAERYELFTPWLELTAAEAGE